MRARTLVVAAVVAGATYIGGLFSHDIVDTAEAAVMEQAAAICAPPTCRKLSLFGLRFSPKLFKVEIKVSESYVRGDNLPTSFQLSWLNGDATAHRIQSVLARDVNGVILGFRDPSDDTVRCDAGGGCFDYDSGSVAARPRGARLSDKRAAPFESDPVVIAKPGTCTFRCAIHPSMAQTVLVSTKKNR